ncbi:hypothetical protein ACOSQ3_018349 [Xanthoceras sorbifolium]
MEEIKEKPPDLPVSSKPVRVESSDDGDAALRKPGDDSFKSKLMTMASPRNWFGFNEKREKLKIGERDTTVFKGPDGFTVKLSEDLKTKLH